MSKRKKRIIVGAFFIGSLIVYYFLIYPFANDQIVYENSIRYANRYLLGHKISQIMVGPDGLYNGKQIRWHPFSGKKSSEGLWKNGYWDGEWVFYDLDENITSIIIYEMGKAKQNIKIINGKKRKIPKEEWKYVVNQDKIGRVK